MGRKLVVSGTKSVGLRAENALGVPFRKWSVIHQPGLATSLQRAQCALKRLNLCVGYQNIPVNLDEAQRQIGIHTEYSIMSARSA